jgi:metal-dependent HD superfamily phosphatase/phosphodiesterase
MYRKKRGVEVSISTEIATSITKLSHRSDIIIIQQIQIMRGSCEMVKTHKQRQTLKNRTRRMFKENKLCTVAFDALENDIEVQTMLEDMNRMAIDRMGYSDHGHTHSLIVVKSGIDLLKKLSRKVQPTIVQEETGTYKDAQVIVMMACYLHDLGMTVHRQDHPVFSVTLATPIINRVLKKVYPKDIHKQVHVRGHILHAITSHDKHITPSTVEAGIVGIADALDMTKGRARIPFELGKVNIHSASALSIENVRIVKGEEKTVRIEVLMNNASGIFQIQELLEQKIRSAPQLVEHIELIATMSDHGETIIGEQMKIL